MGTPPPVTGPNLSTPLPYLTKGGQRGVRADGGINREDVITFTRTKGFLIIIQPSVPRGFKPVLDLAQKIDR